MRAHINDTTLAQSDNTTEIEGNYYFPPTDVRAELLEESDTPYTCPWKGGAQYFHVNAAEEKYEDAAWSYPEPRDSAIEKVGTDFSGYIAFDADKVLTE